MNGTRTDQIPCLEFDGTLNANGYGVLYAPVDGSRLAHRAALAAKLGRPVVGVTRHTCDNPPCIEPRHLIEGTQAENIADAVARGRVRGGRYDQTECSKGHALTKENTRLKPNPACRLGVERVCIACNKATSRAQSARRKQARHERGLLRQRKELP